MGEQKNNLQSMLCGWTDDFKKFRKHVEFVFGLKIESLAHEDPERYANLVLSYGFLQYSAVRQREIDSHIIRAIKQELKTKSLDMENPKHLGLYQRYFKQEYYDWTETNKLTHAGLGWKEVESWRDRFLT